MKNFQRKRDWRNILSSRPVVVVLGIIVIFFAWGVFGFMGKMQVTIENRQIAEKKLAELQKEKAKLSTDIAKLNTPSGVEASIREKFGLAKEGEGLIVVVDDTPAPTPEKSSGSGFFSFFTNLFK